VRAKKTTKKRREQRKRAIPEGWIDNGPGKFPTSERVQGLVEAFGEYDKMAREIWKQSLIHGSVMIKLFIPKIQEPRPSMPVWLL
jgi:hypothetical protein